MPVGDLKCNQFYLEVDNHSKDQDGSKQVGQVGQVLSVEGFPQSADLVLTGGQKVEESNDCAFEFGSTAGVDGGGRERLPDDGLTDVGGNEQGDAGAQAVALLQQLVQQQYDQACNA